MCPDRQIPEEDQKVQRPKCYALKKDGDINPTVTHVINLKEYFKDFTQTFFQKFFRK